MTISGRDRSRWSKQYWEAGMCAESLRPEQESRCVIRCLHLWWRNYNRDLAADHSMKDQVGTLNQMGVLAAFLNSFSDCRTVLQSTAACKAGKVQDHICGTGASGDRKFSGFCTVWACKDILRCSRWGTLRITVGTGFPPELFENPGFSGSVTTRTVRWSVHTRRQRRQK